MNKPSNKIIENVLNGLASADEGRMVAEWFCTDEGQEYLSQQMDGDLLRIKEGCEELHVDHEIPSSTMYSIVMKHVERKKKRRVLFRVAAVLLPFIFIAGLFFQLNSKVDLFGGLEMNEVQTQKGERVQLVFQDGSRVHLNAGSKIRYPKQFGLSKRTIRLEGEAYFVVTSNPSRPFVVELDGADVTVLGTSFNVSAYAEEKEIQVTLDEGKVNMIPWNKTDNILNPGEKLIFDKESGECTIIRLDDTQPISLWKNDIINFQNQSLTEVIKVLNRWYDVEFVVEDPKAYTYSYTMTSENTLLEKVLLDLERVAPVVFTYENKVVRVSMKQK